MKNISDSREAFLALVRVGLWERYESVSCKGLAVSWLEVLRLAEEQSVIGLIASRLEKMPNGILSLTEKLTLLGKCQLIEQRNKAMNQFVAELVSKMQAEGIKSVLVKGLGVAQCYERPLWRSAGDIDFLLDEENYEKAKSLLTPLSDHVEAEDVQAKHQGLYIKGFLVELHGRMPFAMSGRVDRVIEEVVTNTFMPRGTRMWKNGEVDMYIPNADNAVILVFTHFLHHFFIEGVGLKQICDWCRMLWTYRHEIDVSMLWKRLQEAGLMSEWKAFASLAVKTLGMPVDAMPFYDEGFKRKGEMVLRHILKTGNLGQNNDLSYRVKYKGCAYKMVSFWRRLVDFVNFVPIFPLDAPRFFVTYVFSKVK